MERKNNQINPNTGRPKISSRGGARPGSGRPRGSTHKIKIDDLMQSIEGQVQMPYAERLALNYSVAIDRSDWGSVRDYDKVFLNKLVADRNEIEVVDGDTLLEARKQAFALAVAGLTAQPPDTK